MGVHTFVSAMLYPMFNVQLFLLPQCIPNREDSKNGNHGRGVSQPKGVTHVWYYIQGVTGGTDQTSGGCSLC